VVANFKVQLGLLAVTELYSYNMPFVSIYVNMMVQCIGHGFQHLPHQTLYSAFCSEVIRSFAKFNLRFYLR